MKRAGPWWESYLRAFGNNEKTLVARLCLGMHCPAGSACRLEAEHKDEQPHGSARRSLEDSAFPGRAWERGGLSFFPNALTKGKPSARSGRAIRGGPVISCAFNWRVLRFMRR